ncbi:hypothetical protein LCGC14_0876980 [marine sediment metagenome]|uniref:Uncharacterized protein n=1 Tax=marine sediment metagenome TaxID=412755 RepID=A0A0F9P2Z9_9ZZZZ
MAQTKAKDAQRRRLAKPKPPVRVLKGKKRKPKPVIGPRAGIPAGLAAALRKRRAKKAAAKKKREGVKRILSTPKKKKP